MEELIKVSSLGNLTTHIKIKDDILSYGNSAIKLTAVSEFRYGINPIELDMFYIGRRYIIELKSTDEQVKIDFKSFFRISNKYFSYYFNQIIDAIWETTAVRIIETSIEAIIQGEKIQVGNCTIDKKGISYYGNHVAWSDLSFQKKYQMLTLNSKTNPKLWTNLYYLQVYNVEVLLHILNWIYKNGGMEELNNEAR